MKSLKVALQFIFPTVKAILGVVTFIGGIALGASGLVTAIAAAQAKATVEGYGDSATVTALGATPSY